MTPLFDLTGKSSTNVDIDELFDVLHNLFTKLDLIDTSVDNQDISKFAFTRAFPDKSYEQNNVVTFNVCQSKPFTAKSHNNSKDSTLYKPRFHDQQYDTVTGNVKDTYFVSEVHHVEFRCFSRSGQTTNNLAKLLKSLFITHSSVLKKYVRDYRYISTNSLEFIGEYDQKRLFTRPIYFEVYTHTTFTVDLERLKNITLTL
jgi:hypothetical protein